MKTIDTTPLLNINPNTLQTEYDISAAVRRICEPWSDTVPLASIKETIADDFDIAVDDPVVDVIATCPYEDVKCGDLFIGGGDHVVLRFITIDNTSELLKAIHAIDRSNVNPWFNELRHFCQDDENDPHTFVANGHIYFSKDFKLQNAVLWSGNKFKSVPQKKHDFRVPIQHHVFEGQEFVLGGYDYKVRVLETIKSINEANRLIWDMRINHEWVVGKDFLILENIYGFLYDIYLEI